MNTHCPRNQPPIVKIHAIVKPTIAIQTANNTRRPVPLQFFICHLADDKFVR
jgi:hypothetical protein